jgi:hypothetical protein
MARAIFNYIQITLKYANGRNFGRKDGGGADLPVGPFSSIAAAVPDEISKNRFGRLLLENCGKKEACVRLLIGSLALFDFWNPTVATTLLTRPLYSAQGTPPTGGCSCSWPILARRGFKYSKQAQRYLAQSVLSAEPLVSWPRRAHSAASAQMFACPSFRLGNEA